MNDLKEYMIQVSDEIQMEYSRIQKRVKEDTGTAGDNGEENWAKLLEEWLPSTYHVVTKGRIMDIKGNCSPQVDILILSPNYPQYLLKKKEYLASGVIAAFECKLTLRRQHIYDAISTAKIISNLEVPVKGFNERTPYSLLHSEIIYGLISHSYDWNNNNNIHNKIDNAINKGIESAKISMPKELIDLICISNLCTWEKESIIHMKGGITDRKKTQKKDDVCYSLKRYIGNFISQDNSIEKDEMFTPVGGFLSGLLKKMAWKDSSLRSIASYFREVDLLGTGNVIYFRCQSLTNAYGELKEEYASLVIEKQREHLKKDGEMNYWNEWGIFYF